MDHRMRILQIIGLLLCFLLTGVIIELRGLRPVTQGDMRKALESGEESATKLIDQMPIGNIHSVASVESISGSTFVSIQGMPRVWVENEELRITNGGLTSGELFYAEPLKVKIEE